MINVPIICRTCYDIHINLIRGTLQFLHIVIKAFIKPVAGFAIFLMLAANVLEYLSTPFPLFSFNIAVAFVLA